MRIKVRMLSLLSALILILGLFTGCTPEGEDSSETYTLPGIKNPAGSLPGCTEGSASPGKVSTETSAYHPQQTEEETAASRQENTGSSGITAQQPSETDPTPDAAMPAATNTAAEDSEEDLNPSVETVDDSAENLEATEDEDELEIESEYTFEVGDGIGVGGN